MQTAEAKPDLVVVGAGMAGITAALQAQELGAKVLLLEKGQTAGGSMALSGGTVWCARTHDDLRRLVPRGDPQLGRILVDDFPGGVEWLTRLGAELERLPSTADRTVYLMKSGAPEFASRMLARFEAAGGVLRRGTAAIQLETSADGAIAAVVAGSAAGRSRIPARAVILTTGGFQANPEMRARYFGPNSDRLILRSNPRSTGDALAIALGVGAIASRSMSSFYGHLLPGPPAVVPVHDFIAFTQYHSDQGVLLNLRGERFTDESRGDETNTQAVLRQPEAVAVLVYDQEVYKASAVRQAGGGARACDKFHESKALGAPAAVAPTLARLTAEMDAWGACGRAALGALEQYNEAVARGWAAHLPVPRREKALPLATPPFYALLVTPGITFTLGGLKIDGDARVQHRGGWPIPGLYAAGADGGGIHNEQYAGGLCLGLVFGRRAARHAVAHVRA